MSDAQGCSHFRDLSLLKCSIHHHPPPPAASLASLNNLCFLSPFFSSTRLLHFCKFVLRSLYQRSRGS